MSEGSEGSAVIITKHILPLGIRRGARGVYRKKIDNTSLGTVIHLVKIGDREIQLLDGEFEEVRKENP